MTWAEFKVRVENLGVKDQDEIWYIDIEAGAFGSLTPDDVDVVKSPEGWGIG